MFSDFIAESESGGDVCAYVLACFDCGAPSHPAKTAAASRADTLTPCILGSIQEKVCALEKGKRDGMAASLGADLQAAITVGVRAMLCLIQQGVECNQEQAAKIVQVMETVITSAAIVAIDLKLSATLTLVNAAASQEIMGMRALVEKVRSEVHTSDILRRISKPVLS